MNNVCMDTMPSAAEAALPEKPHLSYREVQSVLDCGRQTVRNMVAARRLVAVRLTPGHVGITRESVVSHLRAIAAAPVRNPFEKKERTT